MPTLTYIGHAAFMLEDGENTVLVDPFISGNPAATKHNAEQLAPQTILLTHAHNDHVGDTVAIAKRTGATVIAIVELADWLETQGVTAAIGANFGGTVKFDGGSAKFTPAWHTSSYQTGEGRVAHGVPAGLVVRFSGKTIYFAGDTALFGDMKLIGEEGLDVAVLPIGDHYTMGPADAVRAVEYLNAGTVIPCHYNTFDLIRQDDAEFKRQVEARTTSKVVLLDPGASTRL